MTAPSERDQPARTDPRVVRSRAAAVTATLAVIAERGIAGTTIEAVAERSGVARTTIYRQWPDQPSLVIDAITDTLHEAPTPDTGSLRGDLVEVLVGLAGALQHDVAARLMPALIDAAERDPRFAALHRQQAATRHRTVLQVITRGISTGELPPGTDPDDVLDLLAGPLFYRRWVSAGTVDADFAARVVDRVLAGLGASPAPHVDLPRGPAGAQPSDVQGA